MTDELIPLPRLLDSVTDLERLLGLTFTAEQCESIVAPLEPGVIVAGAGSGKTTVMSARVVWLAGHCGVPPGSVLGLTFTNKAAGELGERVRRALRQLVAGAGLEVSLEAAGDPTISTYHAYAGELIAEHGLRLGIEPGLRVVPDATRFQLAAKVVGSHTGPSSRLSTWLPTVVNQVIALDNQMSDHLVGADDIRRHDERFLRELAGLEQTKSFVLPAVHATECRGQLLELVARYRAAKLDAGVAEFADQMAWGARLAIECPQVGATERGRHQVVLLDEYQDTSVSQRRMLQALFAGGHPVTAVGDPCQGIYGWRGAAVDNIDRFPEHFPRADGAPAPRRHLSVNRRSARRILSVADEVAAPLRSEHPGVRPLTPGPTAADGTLGAALHPTVVDEVAWVVEEVQRLQADRRRGDPAAPWSGIAVLVRNRTEVGALAAELRRAQVPVEVVGLHGLLAQPEVADVLAAVTVVHNLTANADLLRLLVGPRWRIGPRDLALLGSRAAELAGVSDREWNGVDSALADAVRGADPTEIPSLWDAVADPGSRPYSAAARTRFARFAAEMTELRRHVGEPLVELVRRVIDVIGVEQELDAVSDDAARLARDNLALLVETVADYAAHDSYASLHGLLAYLDAEEEYNQGLSVADPTESDAVKLLTIHGAKGLEWDAVVVPFVVDGVFPDGKSETVWERSAASVPWPLRGDADTLPARSGWSGRADEDYRRSIRERRLLEERRLAYVAVTRARHHLVVSGHHWGRTQQRCRKRSDYLTTVLDAAAADEIALLADPPADDVTNPVLAARREVAFPAPLDDDRIGRRRAVAAAVRDAQAGVVAAAALPRSVAERARLDEIAELDAEIDRLLAEAAEASSDVIEVETPRVLSATQLMALTDDPGAFARSLARPMPQAPSAAARFGTLFHAWVEAHAGQQPLLDPVDLPGRADTDIADEVELAELIEAFRSGPYADRVPHQVEVPFSVVLHGQVVMGRIDAVFPEERGWLVVDWKTGKEHTGDPLQLAIYRHAWAELAGVPEEQVRAVFHYVRTGTDVEPPLPELRGGRSD